MAIGKKRKNIAKAIVTALRVVIRYGQLRPSRVRLIGCNHWVYIDPSDWRAVKKLIEDPVLGKVPPPAAFWSAFNQHLKPAVAVDVGVNYGECLFGIRYATDTEVFAFEANPRLAELLEKSRLEHPDGDRMTLTHGLVSDESAENIPFYVNPKWSGEASAIASLNSAPGTLAFNLAAHTLDSIIPRKLVCGQCLLFKMDIEGYESRAFGGFGQTLDAAALAVGLIEFDVDFITAAGESPDAYFQRLAERFDIYRLDDDCPQVILRVGDCSSIPSSRIHGGRIHTDLLLVTRGAPASIWLPPAWSFR